MERDKLIQDELTRSVIGVFYDVYNELGYGFVEHPYVLAMERELRARGHNVAREFGARVSFKGEFLCGYRLDMVVDGKLILELKATDQLPPTALRQLNNYLRSTDLELGLLLHFGPEPKFYRRVLMNQNKKRSVVP